MSEISQGSRRAAIASRETLTGGPELSSMSFLFRNFAPSFGWWMPVLDLYRRLALSSLLLLFGSESGVSTALRVSHVLARIVADLTYT